MHDPKARLVSVRLLECNYLRSSNKSVAVKQGKRLPLLDIIAKNPEADAANTLAAVPCDQARLRGRFARSRLWGRFARSRLRRWLARSRGAAADCQGDDGDEV